MVLEDVRHIAKTDAQWLSVICIIRADENGYVTPWVQYHAHLVSYANLHLLQVSTQQDDTAPKTSHFEKLGAQVHQISVDDMEAVQTSASYNDVLYNIEKAGNSSIIVILEACEFIVCNGVDGVSCEASVIKNEVDRLAKNNASAASEWGFENVAGHLDRFSYVTKPRQFLTFHDARRLNAGEVSEAPLHTSGLSSTSLQIVRVCERMPIEHAAHDAGQNLTLQFNGLKQALIRLVGEADVAQFASALSPAPLVEGFVFELDGAFRFALGLYLDANPDVRQAGMDGLYHFTRHGFIGGRRVSETHQAWYEIYARLEHQRSVQPDGRLGYHSLASIAFRAGKLVEAELTVQAAIDQFGPNENLLKEHAGLALYSNKASELIVRAERYREASPTSVEGYIWASLGYKRANDQDRAYSTALKGLELYPDNKWLQEILAEVRKLRDVALRAGFACSAEAQACLSQFESLGWSCEFGVLQRHYGVDFLSLLKFSNMPLAGLMRAISEDFVDFSNAEQIQVLKPHDVPDGEFFIKCLSYNCMLHTHIRGPDSALLLMASKMRRRVKFLRNKLLDDLSVGEKIFVQLANPGSTLDDMFQFVSAFRGVTRAPLLFVKVAENKSDIGTIKEIAPGFLLGHLSRTGIFADHQDLDFECWLQLCVKASAHFAHRGSPTNAPDLHIQEGIDST